MSNISFNKDLADKTLDSDRRLSDFVASLKNIPDVPGYVVEVDKPKELSAAIEYNLSRKYLLKIKTSKVFEGFIHENGWGQSYVYKNGRKENLDGTPYKEKKSIFSWLF